MQISYRIRTKISPSNNLWQYDLVLQDVVGFFGNMEAYTGTLWEYKNGKGSYDHGFASYALVVIREALANTIG